MDGSDRQDDEAGMKLQFDWKGIDGEMERLAALGKDIDGAVDRAMLPAGEMLQQTMVENAAEETGNLKSQIAIEGPTTDGNLHEMKIGLIEGMADDETMRYGKAQELGTSSMPAHPFNRNTRDTKAGTARKMIKESLAAEGKV
jgi:HK97 gp10 family phage protein